MILTVAVRLVDIVGADLQYLSRSSCEAMSKYGLTRQVDEAPASTKSRLFADYGRSLASGYQVQ